MTTANPANADKIAPAPGPGVREVVITRILDAPRALVFAAWTDPAHVAQWWGPHGFSNPVCELDVRPGGAFRIHMQDPDGNIYPGGGTYHEIVPPERLVFVDNAFPDEQGNPMLEVHNTVTFDELDGKTKLTLRAVVVKAAPEVEEALSGMEQGWSESLERLATHLQPAEVGADMTAQNGAAAQSAAGSHAVTSRDGTRIAFDRYGSGPAVILVTGALGVRKQAMEDELALALAPHFTVLNHDRRGRGQSGDNPPYAVEREIEDIAALIDYAGGSAALYGMSSGAVLALEAAANLGDKVTKLAMFEPPFILDDSHPPLPEDYVPRLNQFIAAGRRSDAVAYFMTDAIGIPVEYVDMMRNNNIPQEWTQPSGEGEEPPATPPAWADMEAVAHTLAYDGTIMRTAQQGTAWNPARWAGVTAPTLVIAGGNSEPFFHTAAEALARDLPNAQSRVLPGQDHAVAPAAIAPMLIDFLKT